MATVRLATTEVQIDDTVYTFGTPADADAFEACVATVDLMHCEADHPPTGKRSAGQAIDITFTGDATPAEDGGVYFEAIVGGKSMNCRITLEALEEHFGVRDGIRPVDAYAQSKEKINSIAEHMLRADPNESVLIRTSHIT
ncbi:MAG: hypothetical protein JWQ21_2098 [Herminiimonas sp.]|nr:hypothetical protein [Herminiimonas sp.]